MSRLRCSSFLVAVVTEVDAAVGERGWESLCFYYNVFIATCFLQNIVNALSLMAIQQQGKGNKILRVLIDRKSRRGANYIEKSKKYGKDQDTIQPSTASDPGNHKDSS